MEQLLRGEEISAVMEDASLASGDVSAAAEEVFAAGERAPAVTEEAFAVGEEAPEIIEEVSPATEKIPSLTGAEAVYDLSAQVLFFPVRHHSPVCSFHLKKAIADYRPDCILIEGPKNAEHLIPVLVHKDTRPPLALYYAYNDREGIISHQKQEYKCYYPFLDCSPELAALREAERMGIKAGFIDLPYMEILAGTAENRGVRREGEKQTYNDDYLLTRSRYLEELCQRTGLRDFEEFWEKYFEIQGLWQETATFVRQMRIYCGLSREHAPQEELEAEGCLLRERYMAQQVAEVSRHYRRILVVTGGFHTAGLEALLEWEKSSAGADGELREADAKASLRFKGDPVALHHIDEHLQTVYPMAYSMEAADALNGYASGMPSPAFYDRVFKGLSKDGGEQEAYREAVLHFLAATGRKARQKEESISVYDEACAFSMAEGLARLRGKKAPGLYELRDCALSSFVKGEHSLSTDGPLRILSRLVTGEQAGELCAEAVRPPLLDDFERQCRLFGLKIHTAAEQECTLEIFSKKKHLQMSRFFYQTEFLGCGFAKRKKGADLVARRDRSRIREVWSYRWSAPVTAALIDASVSGGTLKEAVRARLRTRFLDCGGCGEGAKLLADSFLMGLEDEQERMAAEFSRILAEDGDFFSLSTGFSHLVMLGELQDLYQARGRMDLDGLIRRCFEKLLQLLPFMGQVGEDQQQACMEALRSLYQAAGKESCQEYRPAFAEAMERMLEKKPVNPSVEGAVLGLLYGCDGRFGAQIRTAAEGYMRGTDSMRRKSAAFLRGLFFTAHDFVFADGDFLTLMNGLLGSLSLEEFMQMLPEFRLAFSYFTPMETDRIAASAAALHGRRSRDILRGTGPRPQEYAYGAALDVQIREAMGRMKGEDKVKRPGSAEETEKAGEEARAEGRQP